jgi:FkbM family methyltransferase
MKKLLASLLPKQIKQLLKNLRNFFDPHYTTSYSQEGEDMVLRAIFHNKKNGFYVDVGAHHPRIFSNTYYLYRNGWCGINIDAMPGSMLPFKKNRKNDINIEAAISDTKQTLTYHIFNEPALNTFSFQLAEERKNIAKFKLISTKKIATRTLSEILEEHVPKEREIDVLTIDVEGFDLNVLKSNDWLRYRPKIILVEALNFSFDNFRRNELVSFLYEKRYVLFSKTVNTLFFAECNFQYNTY